AAARERAAAQGAGESEHGHRRAEEGGGAAGGIHAGADRGGARAGTGTGSVPVRSPGRQAVAEAVMHGLAFLIPLVGVVAACAALAVSRSSYYRARKPKPAPKPRPRPARALSDEERAHVLA